MKWPGRLRLETRCHALPHLASNGKGRDLAAHAASCNQGGQHAEAAFWGCMRTCQRPTRPICDHAATGGSAVFCRPALLQVGKLRIHSGHDFLMRNARLKLIFGRSHCAASHGLTVNPASKECVSGGNGEAAGKATAATKASAVSIARPAARALASSSAKPSCKPGRRVTPGIRRHRPKGSMQTFAPNIWWKMTHTPFILI